MSDERMLEDLQRRFDDIARDVPDRAGIESRVRNLAEMERRSNRQWASRLLAVASVAILAAATANWLSNRNAGVVIEASPAQSESVDARRPTDPAGSRFESEQLALGLVLPETDGRRWLLVSETANTLTFSLADDGATVPSATDPTVRIVVASGDRASTIADGLVRDLFDVDLVTDGPAVLGGFDGRQLRLATRGGTDTIGFRLGTGVYVRASGVDRRYVVHLVDLDDAALVLWFDARSEAFDPDLLEADRLFSSVDLDQ